MVDTGNERDGDTPEPDGAADPETSTAWTVGSVVDDTGIHDETVDKTEHAPLAQWASRAAGRPQPEPQEVQAPVDPWPLPIQGLNVPVGAAETDDLLTLQYDPFGVPRPAPAPAKSRRGVRIAIAAAAVVTLAVAGGTTAAMWPSAQPFAQPSPAGAAPASAAPPGTTVTGPASAAPTSTAAVGDDSAPMPTGPVAHGVAPANVFEMDRICAGETYWPTLPSRSGRKAPHPVLIYGDLGGGGRMPFTMFNTWFLKPSTVETTWGMQKDPATIRLVACVDRIAAGSKVRFCPSSRTSSSSEKLTMFRASYRVRLFETATGRRLLDTKVAGNDTACPYVGEVPGDKKVYMEIAEPTLVATLRKFVEK